MKDTPACAKHCRSVFRDSLPPLTSERYTQLWVRLINQIERTNTAASGFS